MPPRFKVGDRVRIVQSAAPFAPYAVGWEGVIQAVNGSPVVAGAVEYRVAFEGQLIKESDILEKFLDPVENAPRAGALCAFCGEPGAPQEIQTGLRCQAETWHVCHRTSCNETIPYHRDRLEAGLVDCAETRASTLRWVKERLGLKA